jgi:hypothetical protein
VAIASGDTASRTRCPQTYSKTSLGSTWIARAINNTSSARRVTSVLVVISVIRCFVIPVLLAISALIIAFWLRNSPSLSSSVRSFSMIIGQFNKSEEFSSSFCVSVILVHSSVYSRQMNQTTVNEIVIKLEQDREKYCKAVPALLRRIDVQSERL